MRDGITDDWRMRLPHNRDQIALLRHPSPDDPWRVLLSGCLFGLPCAVDGTDYGLGGVAPKWLNEPVVQLVPFCPENFALGTPRRMPDLHGGDGFDVLKGSAQVLDELGNDLTDGMIHGAEAMLDAAKSNDVDFALLLDRSGACGSQVVTIGCRFEEPVVYRRGVGVAAAMLLNGGVPVVSQRDHRTLGLLGARIDPAFGPSPEALDHHEHPWVVENLPQR